MSVIEMANMVKALDPETTDEELSAMSEKQILARASELYKATYGGSCNWNDSIENHLAHVI